MTWTAAGSFLFAASSALTVSNQGIGNLLLVDVTNYTDNTVYCTGLSGGGATWAVLGSPKASAVSPYPAYTTTFAGVVTAAGAGTATPAWSGTAPGGYEINGHEFASTAGAWALDVQGYIDDASGSDWASLTPAGSGELYWGSCLNNGSAIAGTTPGYVYYVNPNADGAAYDLSCAGGVATYPVWADGGQIFGQMTLVKETAPAFTAPPNRPRGGAVNRASTY